MTLRIFKHPCGWQSIVHSGQERLSFCDHSTVPCGTPSMKSSIFAHVKRKTLVYHFDREERGQGRKSGWERRRGEREAEGSRRLWCSAPASWVAAALLSAFSLLPAHDLLQEVFLSLMISQIFFLVPRWNREDSASCQVILLLCSKKLSFRQFPSPGNHPPSLLARRFSSSVPRLLSQLLPPLACSTHPPGKRLVQERWTSNLGTTGDRITV